MPARKGLGTFRAGHPGSIRLRKRSCARNCRADLAAAFVDYNQRSTDGHRARCSETMSVLGRKRRADSEPNPARITTALPRSRTNHKNSHYTPHRGDPAVKHQSIYADYVDGPLKIACRFRKKRRQAAASRARRRASAAATWSRCTAPAAAASLRS